MRKVFLSLDRRRGVWQPPLNPAAVLFIALARAVLTLVEFTQAARVAEGADRPRLPAAPALHPTLCRPELTPRSLRRSAAPEPLHNPGKRGWEEGVWGGQGSDFPCLARTCTHIHTDVGAMRPLPLPIPICCPALLPLLPETLPGCSRSERSADLRFFSTCFSPCTGAEEEREGREARREAESR